jgi:hypothetical protein
MIQDQKWQREASAKAMSPNNATGSRSVTTDSSSLQSDLDSLVALMSAHESKIVSLNNATGSRAVTTDLRSLPSDLDPLARPMSAYEPNLGQHKKKRGPVDINLQYSHTGRLIQEDDRGILEHSIMEAAVTLSRTLTDAGIKHCFPGGSLIKLLTKEMSVEDTGWEPERDIREVHGLFVLLGGHPFHILPNQDSQNELHIGFTDLKHDQNITLRFPGKKPSTHSKRRS